MYLGSLFQGAKSIPPDQVRTNIKEKISDPFGLLDVRLPAEYRQGHLPGAVLVPLAQLLSSLGDIPNDKKISCHRPGSAHDPHSHHLPHPKRPGPLSGTLPPVTAW